MLVILRSLSFFHATVRDKIDSSLFFCSTNSRPTIPEGVTGVDVNQGSCRARIEMGGRTLFIGRFPTWPEAARAYDAVAKLIRGT